MPIAFVGAWTSDEFNNNTGGTLTGRTSTAGNFVAIAASGKDPAASFSHSQAGTIQTAIGPTLNATSNNYVWILFIENIVGGAAHTITITTIANSYSTLHAVEYSGIATSGSRDKTASATGLSQTLLTSATATTTQADELLIGCGNIPYSGAGNTFTAGASYTIRGQVGSSNLGMSGYIEDRIVAATGAYTSGATWSGTADNWVAQIATFIAAAPPPALRGTIRSALRLR